MLEHAMARAPQLQAGLPYLLGGVGLLLLIALVLRARSAGSRESHGSARFATLRECRKAGLTARRGVMVGRLHGHLLRAYQRHVLLCAPTGSGKDRSHNFYTTAEWRGSMLIVDVKDGGENFHHCGALRARRGPVVRFSPSERQSASYNLLNAVRWGQPEEVRDVTVLIDSLLNPLKKGMQSSESGQYYVESAKAVLRALTFHLGAVALVRRTAPPSFPAVRAVMGQAAPGLRMLAQSPHPLARQAGHLLKQSASRHLEDIWETARRGLTIFQDPLVAQHSSRSDFRLLDLQYGPRPMTLYLGAESPTDLQYLYPIFRAVLESTEHVLTSIPQKYTTRRWPLLMLLNEFDSLGWMARLEKAPATARSYEIWYVVVVQGLEQLWSTWGHDTPLLAHLTTQIYHAPVGDGTAERLSRRLGQQTIQTESTTRGGRGGRTLHATGRPLMMPEEVLGMDTEQVLVWSQGLKHPVAAQKMPYWEGD